MHGYRALEPSDHREHNGRKMLCAIGTGVLAAGAALGMPTRAPAAGASTTYTVSPIADVSRGCIRSERRSRAGGRSLRPVCV